MPSRVVRDVATAWLRGQVSLQCADVLLDRRALQVLELRGPKAASAALTAAVLRLGGDAAELLAKSDHQRISATTTLEDDDLGFGQEWRGRRNVGVLPRSAVIC